MKIPYKICQSCGDKFYKKDLHYPSKFKKQKFCSRVCMYKYTKENPWNKGKHYSEEVMKKMNFDGLEKGRGLRKGMKFPELSGENHPNWKPKRIILCPICKKELHFAPWQKSRKFCSLRCRGMGKRGVNSPVYKGENSYSKLRTRIYQMPEYVEWRLTCFRRDNFTCQNCKDLKAKPREVHHIKSYSEIKKKYKFTSPEEARKCKALWNVKNGITLCRSCHRMTDSYAKNFL